MSNFFFLFSPVCKTSCFHPHLSSLCHTLTQVGNSLWLIQHMFLSWLQNRNNSFKCLYLNTKISKSRCIQYQWFLLNIISHECKSLCYFFPAIHEWRKTWWSSQPVIQRVTAQGTWVCTPTTWLSNHSIVQFWKYLKTSFWFSLHSCSISGNRRWMICYPYVMPFVVFKWKQSLRSYT